MSQWRSKGHGKDVKRYKIKKRYQRLSIPKSGIYVKLSLENQDVARASAANALAMFNATEDHETKKKIKKALVSASNRTLVNDNLPIAQEYMYVYNLMPITKKPLDYNVKYDSKLGDINVYSGKKFIGSIEKDGAADYAPSSKDLMSTFLKQKADLHNLTSDGPLINNVPQPYYLNEKNTSKLYKILNPKYKINVKKLEEAVKTMHDLGNDVEIIADGRHADNCRIKYQGINPFMMPQYAEDTHYCRACHHLVQPPFRET